MKADDPRHGTTAGHQAHRMDGEDACPPCVAAKSRYEKSRAVYGHRMVPALGTRRRVQALKALGHSGADIAARMGVTYQAVHKIETGTADRIFARTALKVQRAYDEMSMLCPTGYHRTRIRNLAAARGYAPPLAWDSIDTDPAPQIGGKDVEVDPVVVLRILAGDVVPATNAERTEVVRRWVAVGRAVNDLERLTGWKPERYRSAAA
jgi:transcriptional regulator with XRE-family HTH domain